MKEELINDKSIKNNESNTKHFSKNNQKNESEMISYLIIDKLISYVISTSFNNDVNKKITNYCYESFIDILKEFVNFEFLRHDRDDLCKKDKTFDKTCKTPKNERNNLRRSFIVNENEKKINNKSQILNGYILKRDLDPNITACSLDISPFLPKEEQIIYNKEKDEKITMNILVRKNDFKAKAKKKDKLKSKKPSELKDNNSIDDIFKLDKNEKIEKIEKIESHKMDYSINKNSNIIINNEMVNSWDLISQPKSSPIDRFAATKIKLDRENMGEDNTNIQKINNGYSKAKQDKIKKSLNKTKLRHSIFNLNKNGKESPKKVFPKIQTDLPSYDIDEKYKLPEETEEIKNIREKYENEIKEKKLEEIKLEKEKKEREKQKIINEKKKNNINTNITVDAKGNLVFIKPINIDSLIKDFNIKIFSDSKLIKNIKDSNIINQKSAKNVEVEINNNPEYSFLEQEKVGQNKNINNSNKIENLLESIKKKKNVEIKIEKNLVNEVKMKRPINHDKNVKIISGSNFELMNLECGVNLTEDNQKKSGGRDYLHKYGRFSFDSYENQLYRTTNSFYTKQLNNNNDYININVSNGDDSNEQKVKAYSKQKDTCRQSATPSKMKEKIDEIRNTPPSGKNKYLYLKTKNLKSALSNLDLINEKDFSKKNLTSQIKLFNKGKNKRLKKLKKHLEDINKFNWTLIGNKFQATPKDNNKKQVNRKLPTKPDEKILRREVSQKLMKHLPRQRLPPILSELKSYVGHGNDSDIFKNDSLFKNKKKLKEIKSKNLSKDSLIENKKKYYLTSTNGFFSNKKRIDSSTRNNDEIKEYIFK